MDHNVHFSIVCDRFVRYSDPAEYALFHSADHVLFVRDMVGNIYMENAEKIDIRIQ